MKNVAHILVDGFAFLDKAYSVTSGIASRQNHRVLVRNKKGLKYTTKTQLIIWHNK